MTSCPRVVKLFTISLTVPQQSSKSTIRADRYLNLPEPLTQLGDSPALAGYPPHNIFIWSKPITLKLSQPELSTLLYWWHEHIPEYYTPLCYSNKSSEYERSVSHSICMQCEQAIIWSHLPELNSFKTWPMLCAWLMLPILILRLWHSPKPKSKQITHRPNEELVYICRLEDLCHMPVKGPDVLNKRKM